MVSVSRRQILVGGTAAAGLVVAWQLVPRTWPDPLDAGPGETGFGAYLKIAADGSVTVAVPQCEMGQGVTTVIPQIVARELGADWRSVAVEAAPVSAVYANHALARKWARLIWPSGTGPLFDEDNFVTRRLSDSADYMLTADSTTLANYELPAREAGAAARSLLCQAAAARWNIAWEACETQNGFVTYQNRRLRFADLLEEAKTFDVPDPVPLHPVPGSDPAPINASEELPWPRLDLPAKVDGSANFAGDIRLPDMVYAAIRQGPVGDSTVKSVDRRGARDVTGLIEVVEHERWVAAVAGNWWAANRALSLIRTTFTTRGRLAGDDAMEAAFARALGKGGEGRRLYEAGDVDAAFAGKRGYAAEYSAAAAPHATIETSAATARLTNGQLELWLATQSPQAARESAARALGLSVSDVVLYPMMAGGSFDRRLDNEIAAQAAQLARHMQRPVQLVWSRGEEMIHDPVRPPMRARMTAVTDTSGRIAALSARIAAPATAQEFARRLFDHDRPDAAMRAAAGQYDYGAIAGAVPPYAIAAVAADHFPVDLGIVTGRWTANADGPNCFFIESFIDELAHRAGREPLSYRMQMLPGQPRLARCLTGVAVQAGWDGGLDNSGQGLACHVMDGACIAVIASAQQGAGGFQVERLTAMADIGRIVNRDIALQQIECGLISGLATAMGCATGYAGGLATARALRDLDLPLLASTPQIDITLVDSDEDPVDPGEIGVPAVAPAIANALFSASGIRLRTLPLLSDGL